MADKPCQDASYSKTTGEMSIAIVCDGHGGERYFRSDVGAQCAIEATKDAVETFIKAVDENLFKGKPLTRKQAIASEAKTNILTKDTPTDSALRQLFASVIFNWREKIARHAQENPLTEGERAKVDGRYCDAFENGNGIEKTYGCTLMCYVHTPSWWFAFHIGDGKCIAFDMDGQWSEPIPWDDRCFLNRTTSLCDAEALDGFRYCYCGDGSYPLAVFLGSDGIDDSFGETENMVNFYIQILKLLLSEGESQALATLKDSLPQLSKMGSKDDMSVACVYDEQALPARAKNLIDWQREYVAEGIRKLNERIVKQQGIISSLKPDDLSNQKAMIDYQYANKELTRAFAEKKALAARWNHFSRELSGDTFSPYEDEIGFGDAQEENEEPAQGEGEQG